MRSLFPRGCVLGTVAGTNSIPPNRRVTTLWVSWSNIPLAMQSDRVKEQSVNGTPAVQVAHASRLSCRITTTVKA